MHVEMGYDMQTNPSYGMGVGPGSARAGAGSSRAGAGSSRVDRPLDSYSDITNSSRHQAYHKSTSATGRAEPTGHYFGQDATGEFVGSLPTACRCGERAVHACTWQCSWTMLYWCMVYMGLTRIFYLEY